MFHQLHESQAAYQDYLDKVKLERLKSGTSSVPSDDYLSSHRGPYANVRPNSPNWQALKTKYKAPEQIKVWIESAAVKEIPETSPALRQATTIPIKYEVDKAKIRKEYRHCLGKAMTQSSDSEYESKNLQQWLSKKRDKGATSLSVLRRVETRLKQKKDNSVMQFG